MNSLKPTDAHPNHPDRSVTGVSGSRRRCGAAGPAHSAQGRAPDSLLRLVLEQGPRPAAQAGRSRRGGAVTLVERKSGYLLLGRAPDLQAATVREVAAQRYRSTPAALRKTLTLDNGKEFAEHEQLEVEAALRIYFAKPYSAWQRGLNENTNGLIRQFFPKGTDLANIPEHRFTKVQQLLNDRPRKRLGYRTPNEVLASRLHPNGCD